MNVSSGYAVDEQWEPRKINSKNVRNFEFNFSKWTIKRSMVWNVL